MNELTIYSLPKYTPMITSSIVQSTVGRGTRYRYRWIVGLNRSQQPKYTGTGTGTGTAHQ